MKLQLFKEGTKGALPPSPPFSSSQYELQSGEFAPFGRELSALQPKNSPPRVGCFWARFQNENCWPPF